MAGNSKTVIVGAGPVGSLAALYAAQRGHDVEIYELRNDLRDPLTTPLLFSKSINLALSERGINALRQVEHGALLSEVFKTTIPMRGRMIHGNRPSGELYEEAQDYDAHGRTIFAVDRTGLNGCLLDALERTPNVKFFFNHKLTGADFRARKAWFEVQDAGVKATGRAREIEIDFDLLIGADGAHSSVRYHLMKYARVDYKQEYIDALWCEFHMEPRKESSPEDPMSRFAISPNHLHIWPGKKFMFIAIPSDDGSFTCTLFMPSAQYAVLETQPSEVPAFFDQHFPGVTALISPDNLIASFTSNAHLPLINVNCKPYHFQSSVVILGDAAHAMVPFYGQGMNCGLEDVRILFSILDKYETMDRNAPDDQNAQGIQLTQRALALAEYTALRVPDAFAINDLALKNYIEMRSSVLSPTYRLRKYLEEQLSLYFPSLGWKTKYARVSFGNERYSDVVKKSEHQGKVLLNAFIGAMGVPILAGTIALFWRYRRS
ncbi:FAD dependent oxidoreductase [Grosmannia clavigera kw1407]|uniref:Kynurenine 3-monooxygenase n=1 Tax=Grosmannia clavigera (strain kw1407 / UAMH 11150) TaxID=655863 RepID=F0XUP5_GROCL|nr:FAD dependent oxidoreductase [Grosmannia clavigera kw1407]EFW98976.1 FAD dependent oxidoreductase [Grosmannia clavigera kw1407]